MLDLILQLDCRLFMFFNSYLTNSFFDWFMPFITDAKTWVPLIFLIWLYVIIKGNKRVRVIALAALVATGLADPFCARILKKNIKRSRPCAVEETETFSARMLTSRRGSRSFPSNHAANTAAFAATITFAAGIKLGWPLVIASLLVGYSRVYCGVHYPFDVLMGWLIGTFFGWFMVKVIVNRYWPAKDSVLVQSSAPKPVEPESSDSVSDAQKQSPDQS